MTLAEITNQVGGAMNLALEYSNLFLFLADNRDCEDFTVDEINEIDPAFLGGDPSLPESKIDWS